MGGRSSYLARGKLLGGSSSTNATLYHRGSAEDYDSWGLSGWGSEDVLPWFVSMEDNPAFGDTKYHGTGAQPATLFHLALLPLLQIVLISSSVEFQCPVTYPVAQSGSCSQNEITTISNVCNKHVNAVYMCAGGAMHVENPIYKNPLFEKHFQASAEAGYKANPDFNDWSRSQEGYGEFQVAITGRGRRADSYRQFLKPVLGRENLEVVIRTQVSKIAFETRNGTPTAVGVDVQSILVRCYGLQCPCALRSCACFSREHGNLECGTHENSLVHNNVFASVELNFMHIADFMLCEQPGTPIKATGTKSSVSIAAGGEVLLAAGAIHSPHVLLASGVGPKKQLSGFNIDTVSDLSGVGENLQACTPCMASPLFCVTTEELKEIKSLRRQSRPGI